MSPIFTYHCQECGVEIDLIRKISQVNKPVFCEECNSQCQHVPEIPSKFVRGGGSWSTPA